MGFRLGFTLYVWDFMGRGTGVVSCDLAVGRLLLDRERMWV